MVIDKIFPAFVKRFGWMPRNTYDLKGFNYYYFALSWWKISSRYAAKSCLDLDALDF